MRVYIAGRFEDRARLAAEAQRLQNLGPVCTVISSWLKEFDPVGMTEHTVATAAITPAEARAYAVRDIQEVKTANVFILDSQGTNIRAGREVEWGIALTRMIPRYIVGPARNVFHELATRRYDTWDAFLEEFAPVCREGLS